MGPKKDTQAKSKRRYSSHNVDDDLEEWKKSKQLLKPKDQVELSDLELKEIVSRNLVLQTKQVPQNIVEFSYIEGSFVDVSQPTNYVIVFEKQGCYLHKSSEEAKQQYIDQGLDLSLLETAEGPDEDEAPAAVATKIPEEEEGLEEGVEEEGEYNVEDDGRDDDRDRDRDRHGEEDEEAEGEGEEGAQHRESVERGDDDEEVSHRPKGKLKNQFNFCERAALSLIPPNRNQESQTVPPPTKDLSGLVLQWVIYDAYQDDWAEQEREKEKERERKERAKESGGVGHKPHIPPPKSAAAQKKEFSEEVVQRVFECWKVLERMVNLNSYDDIAKDYRYWEDPSDEYRDDEGTLLPLWKYQYDKLKEYTVTYLMWNEWYYDLFIACFGSVDFLKPSDGGYICLYTIKNPSFPETICYCDSPVMCADVHRNYPYMLVCGKADGNVSVYNIHGSVDRPAFQTKSYKTKCLGIVWAVKWLPDLQDGELNFFAVSNDGVVKNYVLMQSEFAVTHIIKLTLDTSPAAGPDGTLVPLNACATTLVMHPKDPHIYLVGTEEGFIYKCSVHYSSQYLLTYRAHTLPVYKINYNYFNSDIFISCSGDWRIKIWEDGRLEPLFSFDLGAVINDVQWAPYSSTVFAAVTCEGKVYVFDLNMNKYKPICVQAVVSKKRYRLTTIAFNNNLPIIIVGDDKGCVTSLKLSPNLRIPCKPPKKQQHLDQFTLQCMKLEKLLSVVREPLVLSVNQDVTSTLIIVK